MTLPPPIPLVYAPPPPPGARVAGVWLCILLAMVLFIGLHSLHDPGAKAAEAQEASTLQLEMAAKYIIGMHAVLPPSALTDLHAADESIDKLAAESLTLRLRAIMVDGELYGSAAAQTKLETFLREAKPASPPHDGEALLRLYRAGPNALTADEKDRLRSHHRWFGQLALSAGLPSGDPARTAAINPAIRLFIFMAVSILIGLFALLAGLILLITGIVLLATGKLRRAFQPALAAGYNTIFLEVFAIYLASFALLSAVFLILSRTPHPHLSPLLGILTLLVMPLPLIWPRLRGLSWAQTRQAFGLGAPRGALREIAFGLVGYIAGLPILGIGFLITFVLTKLTKINPTHPIVSEAGGGFWAIILMLLFAAVWAPITEELMFRGALFSHLRQRLGWFFSALVVALIFASLHPQGWVAIPVLGAIAMVLAGIREWRGSIIGCMAAHALNNAMIVALLAVATS